MRHTYALRKFNRVGPPEELNISASLMFDTEAMERALRQFQDAMPSVEEIARNLADASRRMRQ